MTKGWNKDYLNEMINKYSYLSKVEENPETKELYEEICELYKMLNIKLLFQDGEVYCTDVDTKFFLDEYNEANNIHIYPRYYERVMNRFALEIENSPRIVIPKYRRKISKEESFDIVGAFIEHYFGDEALEIYESKILDKPEYTLYDHIDDVSSVTFVGDEAYL